MECLSDQAYASREDLAQDIVRVPDLFKTLPANVRLGIGFINQKLARVGGVETVAAGMKTRDGVVRTGAHLFHAELRFRNVRWQSVSSSELAEAHLYAMSQAVARVKQDIRP